MDVGTLRATGVYADFGNQRMTVLLKALRSYITDIPLRNEYDRIMRDMSLECDTSTAPDLLEATLTLLRGTEALNIPTSNAHVVDARTLLQQVPFYNLPVLNNGINQRMRLLRNIETYVMVTLLREADGYPVDVKDTDNSLLTAIH